MSIKCFFGTLTKFFVVISVSTVFIPLILGIAFTVLKINLTLKNLLATKDTFFYNNIGDISWMFNLLVDFLQKLIKNY